MEIDYDHSRNLHTVRGAEAALAVFFKDWKPASLLDVGCGTGTWINAALEQGVRDVYGVDGVEIPEESLLFDRERFRNVDLTGPWNLGRRFDVALCLEVAEHLDEIYADGLIESLTRHSDTIVFSAACPGQLGQHHVNCQWPYYWQWIFNSKGFACSDPFRRLIWDMEEIEPWYRQNVFLARRSGEAGSEPRVPSVKHPTMDHHSVSSAVLSGERSMLERVESGYLSMGWYVAVPFRAFAAKIGRRLSGHARPAE